jgi:AsmA protein
LTALTGFRRLGFIFIAVISAWIVLLTGTSYLISAADVRERTIQEIHTVTGLSAILRGEAAVSLFPAGTVSFADVTLGDPARPALTAQRLIARLRFLPLLIGRVEIADISLERPTVTIDLGMGKSNWSGLIETLATQQKREGSQRVTAFSEMRIENGTVVLRNSAQQILETLEDVDFSLAWPSISKSFGGTGRFVWHGEPTNASLTLTDFRAALTGARSGLKLRLTSRPIKTAFEGTISVSPILKLEGALAADGDSLRDVLIWTGHKSPPGGGFGQFGVKANASVIGSTISLTGVNIELDGNTMEGALAYANDGRKTLQGTLASDMLDLSPYISTMRLLTANHSTWDNAQIDADGLTGLDVDLRLSAAKVVASTARIDRTAVGVNLRGGHLVVTIGESQAYGGLIQGSLTVANSDHGISAKSQLQFTSVNLQTCLSQLFGIRQLDGKGNISLSVEGEGQSVLALTHTLDGTATLIGENGVLSGLDVEKLLRRLETRPLSGGGDFRAGNTPYNKITVNLNIKNGIITTDDADIDGAAVKLSIAGSASIPTRSLDLKGSAALLNASSAGAAPFELPFVVQGSWDDPIMLPDAESLIRHSGAAAPLLRAIGDHGTSDKVRSVIEKFTGAPKGTTPAAEHSPDFASDLQSPSK